MKLSQLKGKSVVSVTDARKAGVVADVLVDPSYRKIDGLVVKADRHAPSYVVSMDNVRGIGPDAVTVTGHEALLSPERAGDLARLPSLSAILDCRVVTEGGVFLGKIDEVDFDPTSHQIASFEYESGGVGGLFARHRILSPGNVLGVGPNMVTVRESERTEEQR